MAPMHDRVDVSLADSKFHTIHAIPAQSQCSHLLDSPLPYSVGLLYHCAHRQLANQYEIPRPTITFINRPYVLTFPSIRSTIDSGSRSRAADPACRRRSISNLALRLLLQLVVCLFRTARCHRVSPASALCVNACISSPAAVHVRSCQ